jgi:general secretion pathway protein D
VQRQEVGTILKVTPQIAAEGNAVVLKISIESSSVLPTSVSNVDITTAKRTITTNVLIDDGGVVVLGGLISNSHTQSGQRVPLLGSIPIIGNLFRTRQADGKRNNLMMFIRPKILRDAEQAAFQTDSKYNYMRDQQTQYNKSEFEIPLLPGVKKPKLDALPLPPPPGTTPPAAGSPDEKARQAKERDEKLRKSAKPPGKTDTSQPPFEAPRPPDTPRLPQPPAGSVATPPNGATTHPEGEPPYATEGPGVLMPQPAPQPNPPPPERPKP